VGASEQSWMFLSSRAWLRSLGLGCRVPPPAGLYAVGWVVRFGALQTFELGAVLPHMPRPCGLCSEVVLLGDVAETSNCDAGWLC